jgi:deoxyribose-phosphate aldolase
MIDYPLLAPELSDEHIAEGCRLAREWSIAAIVVRPVDVDQVIRYMDGSSVAVASTVGYPSGISVTGTKLYEGRDLLRRGVKEVEFVINIGKMISRQFQYVETELMQMAKSCLEVGATLKVNLRSELLDDDLKIIATKICKRVDAQMLSIAGSERDFNIIRPVLKDRLMLKVASNLTTMVDAMQARANGACRFSSSAAAQILTDWKAHLEAEKKRATAPTELRSEQR